MELDSLVRCSDTVATTRSRSAKLVRLSELLRTLHGPELELGTRYLCGVTRQDKLGVGPALLRALLDTAAAPEPSLSLTEVDGLFGQ
ncbi:MAG: ATP-dependent DNA ligase, partial [Gammaproteobacteria bacterium]|nr:ATP-dependent DNA ligase [Gammaproteobacteria bacterium]